jgi:hypothetical protein
MDGKIEQYVSITFVKFGESTIRTLELLHEAFGQYSVSRTVVFEWDSCFEPGQASVDDDECLG